MYMSDRNRQRESTIRPVIVIIGARGDRYSVVNNFGVKLMATVPRKGTAGARKLAFAALVSSLDQLLWLVMHLEGWPASSVITPKNTSVYIVDMINYNKKK